MVVFTDELLKTLLQWPDISRRMVKWAIKLGEFGISYQPQPSIKVQVFANFIIKCTIPKEQQPEKGLEEDLNEDLI